ncbi:hypothetical protein Q1695_012637 [Nippostrongylus brasiliensis]|nr:hypothetical protein Q1695_012637 [Nippostrongylus brasiliensis]
MITCSALLLIITSIASCLDPRCELDIDPGDCLAIVPSYGYNKNTLMCESFTYGGCGGNGNRFNSQDDCENVCVRVPLFVDE